MTDVVHAAAAALSGEDFLLTWNTAHIANAHTRPLVEAECRACGYRPPVLCTPEELTGRSDYTDVSTQEDDADG